MKTLAELTAERDRIQAMIDRGEYVKPSLRIDVLDAMNRCNGGRITQHQYLDEIEAITRRHLLPIVTAGEAKEGEHGLAWDGSVWYAAKLFRGEFYPAAYLGANLPLYDITHWLPAARVPGPEGEKP